jgi:hypothetical protein
MAINKQSPSNHYFFLDWFCLAHLALAYVSWLIFLCLH